MTDKKIVVKAKESATVLWIEEQQQMRKRDPLFSREERIPVGKKLCRL